jgi:hypothetical protein
MDESSPETWLEHLFSCGWPETKSSYKPVTKPSWSATCMDCSSCSLITEIICIQDDGSAEICSWDSGKIQALSNGHLTGGWIIRIPPLSLYINGFLPRICNIQFKCSRTISILCTSGCTRLTLASGFFLKDFQW